MTHRLRGVRPHNVGTCRGSSGILNAAEPFQPTWGGEIPTVVAIVEATGEPVEETEPEAEAATPKPRKTKKAPEWRSLPDAEKAQYLLDHPTISDRTWTEEPRLAGERRDAFIHRILGFPKAP